MAASQPKNLTLRDDFVEIELDLQRDVLQTLHGDLVHGIRAVDVCSKLFAVGLLTEREQSDILAQASHSPHDATEMMVSALRRLHKGKETSSILYRVLKEIRGYQDIAERIRQAFSVHGVEISATASLSVPSPRSPISSETPPSALPTPVQVSTSDRPQSRPLDELLQTTVKQGAPTPPKSVCVPSQVDDLLTEFAHLVARAYEVVCGLPPNKLKSLRKLLATLLRQHSLSEEVVVGETGEEVAEIVTSGDQDIINHSWLKESVRIIADPDLLKLYGEFNDMLKQHKEKCISSPDVFPKQNPLCPAGEARSVLEIVHKQKSHEEFLFEYVHRELSFLQHITGSERVRFEGFRSGSVYLYFSMPKEVEYILVSEIVRNLEWFVEWGVTNVTVYDFFTLNLEGKPTLTNWRTEIDLRRRHELEEAKSEVEGLKMSHHNKSKLTGVKKFAGTRSLSGVGSSVRKMDKELQITKKLSDEAATESAKTIQQLEEKVEALLKKEGGTSTEGSTEQISRQETASSAPRETSLRFHLPSLMPYVPHLAHKGQQIAGYLDMYTQWQTQRVSAGDLQTCLQALLAQWLEGEEDEERPYTWEFFLKLICLPGIDQHRVAKKIRSDVFVYEDESEQRRSCLNPTTFSQTKMNKTLAELREAQEQTEARCQKLDHQCQELRQHVSELEAELQKALEQNEECSIRCQELRQHKAELKSSLKEVHEEATEVWLILDKYRKRIIELKALLSNIQEKLSKCQAELNTAEQERKVSSIKCQQLEKQCQLLRPLPVELQEKLNITQAELQKAIEQNEGSSIRCQELRQHKAELKVKLDKTQEGLTKALEKNEGSSIRCQELEQECQDLRQHKAELEALLNNIHEELSQCQAELNTAEQENEAGTIKCQQLEKLCQQLCISFRDDLEAKISSCCQDHQKGITEAVRSHSEAPESKDPCQLSPAEKRSQSTPGERRDVEKTERTASILLQDIEDQKPETSDVVRLIGNSVCFKWKVFGCHLRVKDTLLNKIQCDNPHSVDDCFLNLISLWLQGNGDTGSLQRTWKTVLSTTEEMDLPNVTAKLFDKLQDL